MQAQTVQKKQRREKKIGKKRQHVVHVPQQLIVNGHDLFHTFDNMVDVFELFFVLEDLKPVARIEMHQDKYAKVLEFCTTQKLALELSSFKIVRNTTDPGNNTALMVKPEHTDKGSFFAYISKRSDDATHAKFYEHIRNDNKLGELLGYPECCRNFYDDKYAEAAQLGDEYSFFSIANTKEAPLFYTNNMLRFFGVTLMSHFPCSFNCVNSLFQGKRRFEAIHRKNPALAEYVKEVLRGPVIAHASTGVHALKRTTQEGDTISYKDVWLTSPNPMHNLLSEGTAVEMLGMNHIKIKNKNVLVHEEKGDGLAMVVFE
jgi:hypothetical protein